MPWVLGHDMSSDYFAKFAVRNRAVVKSQDPEDRDVSTMYGQWVIFKLGYQYMGFGRPGKQIGMSSNARGPRQVFYVYQVRDEVPPVLRYGVDGCPPKHQLETLRLMHGGRREMWYPKEDTLPWDSPLEAKLPRPVVYEDEIRRSANPSSSDREARASGIENRMRMMRIDEGTESAPSTAGPSDKEVVTGRV